MLKLAAKKGYASARRAHQIRKLTLFNAGPNLLCNPSSAARQTMQLFFWKLGALPNPYAMEILIYLRYRFFAPPIRNIIWRASTSRCKFHYYYYVRKPFKKLSAPPRWDLYISFLLFSAIFALLASLCEAVILEASLHKRSYKNNLQLNAKRFARSAIQKWQH